MSENWVSTTASASLAGRASRDTVPELLLRRALHRRGLRYRLHVLIGKRMTADIVFKREKVVVFVDGCFWHFCPKHGHMPRPGPNSEAWHAKFKRVKDRETEARLLLEGAGYLVIRVWECEVRSKLRDVVCEVVRAVSSRLKPPTKLSR